MEKDRGTRAGTDGRPDRHTERETEPRPPATERPRETGGVVQETYERAIEEAVEDVHG